MSHSFGIESLTADLLATDVWEMVRDQTPETLSSVADRLENIFIATTAPEWVRMFIAIARGNMGGNVGWFGPGQSRFTWDQLARRHGIVNSGAISLDIFQGNPAWFRRLDRNGDGSITAEDLDWSDRSPWVQFASAATRFLRRIDTTGNGRVTRQEWCAFFDSVAGTRDEIKFEEVRDAWLSGFSSGFFPGTPTQSQLISGMFSGELGSIQEGPALNQRAPDFELTTHDSRQTIRLSDQLGSKPVVLVFGNFTCPPFRSIYPAVEEVYQRFRQEAIFLGIYVREAHPTDGWLMESNRRVGVCVSQPKAYEDRLKVADQCHRLLDPEIPLLVDEIDDAVGNAYSGMPTRTYVLHPDGSVVYKAGRGPFGFKVGEMEQALIMTLLDLTH